MDLATMLTPEPMQRVDLFLLADDLNQAARTLAGVGSLHLVDQRRVILSPEFEATMDSGRLAAECRDQVRIANDLLARLDADPVRLEPGERRRILHTESAQIMEQARHALVELRYDVNDLLERIQVKEKAIGELNSIAEEMQHLHKLGLGLGELRRLRYLCHVHGIMERSALGRMREYLQGVTCYYSVRDLPGRRVSVLVLAGSEQRAALGEAMLKAGLREHEIPERFHVSREQGLDLVEAELWRQRDELARLRRQLDGERPRWCRRLTFWQAAISLHHDLLTAADRFGRRRKLALVSGFVPRSRLAATVAGLQRDLPGRFCLRSTAAADIEGAKVPTRLRHGRLWRLFEPMVTTYGLPGYRDMDPTVIVGISFLLMFGMMFGDVGHGLVLALMGAAVSWLPYRIFLPLRGLGKIIMLAGASGACFGLLFGSVFGVEDDRVLPALWMRPSHQENLAVFLGAAMGFGVLMLSLGIILNIAQCLRRGRTAQALWGQWSLASLGFYWLALGLLAALAWGWRPPVPAWGLVALLATPLAAIVIGQLLAARRAPRGAHGEHRPELASLLLEPVEIVMNCFSNTLSFLRVGAFGLAHAALCMATFIVRDMMPDAAAGFLTLPLEHLAIIVLEGLIVSIQCLRLEYYEFFSKFFDGSGVAYAPLAADWGSSLSRGD